MIRKGFSLLEVIIASTILVVVMGLIMQSMVSSVHLTSMGFAEDDVAIDGHAVVDRISTDLAQSGWAFSNSLPLAALGSDRTIRYFPYVQQQALSGNIGGLGSVAHFGHTHRNPNMVRLPALPAGLPGSPADADTVFGVGARAQYLASFYARSQEIIFLRVSTLRWSSTPSRRNALLERFPDGDWTDTSDANRAILGVLHPSGWKETAPGSGFFTPRVDVDLNGKPDQPYGRPLFAGELDSASSDLRIRPAWDTTEAYDYDGDATNDSWREYMYCVIPSPIGLGRLVRAYKARLATETSPSEGLDVGQFITPLAGLPVFGMKIDEVLSDHVVRILFDTCHTAMASEARPLDVNQVRLRVYFARRSQTDPQMVITRILESVLAMRARVLHEDLVADQGQLGSPAPFPF